MSSWVIVSKSTGQAVAETFSQRIAGAVNADKYEAIPILEYLGNFNAEIRRKDQS